MSVTAADAVRLFISSFSFTLSYGKADFDSIVSCITRNAARELLHETTPSISSMLSLALEPRHAWQVVDAFVKDKFKVPVESISSHVMSRI